MYICMYILYVLKDLKRLTLTTAKSLIMQKKILPVNVCKVDYVTILKV